MLQVWPRSHHLEEFESSLNPLGALEAGDEFHQMVIRVSVVLPKNLVFFFLPKKLVFLALAFQILDKITAREGQRPEEGLELPRWDLEIFLEHVAPM